MVKKKEPGLGAQILELSVGVGRHQCGLQLDDLVDDLGVLLGGWVVGTQVAKKALDRVLDFAVDSKDAHSFSFCR